MKIFMFKFKVIDCIENLKDVFIEFQKKNSNLVQGFMVATS